jgi:hypothetical protein
MRYLVVFLIGLFALPIQASVKVDVFKTEVILDENESDAEKVAKIEGFKQVIVKASGDKNAINNPVIKKALNKNGSYLSQIGYGEEQESQTLQMVFSPPQIQSLLNQADLPYWSAVRSNLVVWVIQEGEYGREILWEHTGDSSLNQIKFFSDLRGLPIIVPIGDIEDLTTISGPDLWGGFTAPISAASQRYSTDAVLVIRVQKAANGSYVRWTLYDEKPQFIVDSKRVPVTGEASGNTHEALEVVIDEVSNYYARKSSIKSSGQSEDTIVAQFIEVDSAISFFTLEKLLKGLSSVAGVDVDKIVGNEVTFKIHLLGTEIDFETEVIQSPYVKKFELFEPEEEVFQPIDDGSVEANIDTTGQDNTNLQELNGTPSTEPLLQVEQQNGPAAEGVVHMGSAEDMDAQALEIEETATLVFEWVQ